MSLQDAVNVRMSFSRALCPASMVYPWKENDFIFTIRKQNNTYILTQKPGSNKNTLNYPNLDIIVSITIWQWSLKQIW
ncbi:hypothetical protein MT325_m790R [Paramecium bursaria chlorella virus MT325]|uniref:Uncharacterized protein m790R n=1 Tax=Paramecium bursaria Chlorella virus MT325 TaxID=346932 RepID=A7IVH0_PBCVM|nr:hypothetical protein MT325_m790R [Paramecium bursaria chlorella virus MT325]